MAARQGGSRIRVHEGSRLAAMAAVTAALVLAWPTDVSAVRLEQRSATAMTAPLVARGRGVTVVAGDGQVTAWSIRGRDGRKGALLARLALPADPTGMAVLDRTVFLATSDGRLLSLDLEPGRARRLRTPAAAPVLAGATRLAAMDGYLVAAESGVGLSILRAGGTPDPGRAKESGASLAAAGFYPEEAALTAVAASDRLVYAATSAGEILVLDALAPELPTLAAVIPAPAPARALAANGTRLYVLADDGLRILETATTPPEELLHRPDIRGDALTLAGRELQVGSETGLVTWLDEDPAPQMIRVSVNNNFFSPEDVVLHPGDTVSWRNLSGFHNVASCTEYGFGCERGPAVEVFTSGPVAGPPWIFNHTFTVVGFNPYRCIPHSPFMVGTVTTEPPAPPPLPVSLDVRPGSCTNPLNPRSRGVLPAAVLGTAELDVTAIDAGSLRLAGVPPLRWSLEDVASPDPVDGTDSTCPVSCPGEADGIPDLVLMFDSAAVAGAAAAGEGGACVPLELTGRMIEDGAERGIVGLDAVRTRPLRSSAGR